MSSCENPDDDDIMISALVSAMAKGREISASLGGGTDPVRVTVNLDAPEPPTTRLEVVLRSTRARRVRLVRAARHRAEGSLRRGRHRPGPRLRQRRNSAAFRPNAPGARWVSHRPGDPRWPNRSRRRRRAAPPPTPYPPSPAPPSAPGGRGGHRGPRVGGQGGGGWEFGARVGFAG